MTRARKRKPTAAQIAATCKRVVAYLMDPERMRCSESCLGWFVGDHGIERCDDCAHLAGVNHTIQDDDIALALRVHANLRSAR